MTTTPPSGGPADGDTTADDAVVLWVPADARHAATARVVAASLAADLGFTVDEIDELRLGINEAVAVLADEADGSDEADRERDARLEVEFHASSAPTARIDVTVRRVGDVTTPALDDLADRILGAVVDHHELVGTAVRLSKRTGSIS